MGLLTVDQLCKELSVSRSKIFNLRKEGALPFIKLGRRVLFSTKQVKKSLGLQLRLPLDICYVNQNEEVLSLQVLAFKFWALSQNLWVKIGYQRLWNLWKTIILEGFPQIPQPLLLLLKVNSKNIRPHQLISLLLSASQDTFDYLCTHRFY